MNHKALFSALEELLSSNKSSSSKVFDMIDGGL